MKVSVCIPAYNQGEYLENAIRSAVQQTYVPFEIIVSDDCSTDSTNKVLQKLALEIPYLKVYKQPYNLGLLGNVDTCLRLATGDFIVRLDSDDYLNPDYIKLLVGQLIKHPNAGYGHAAVQEVDANGLFLNHRVLFRKPGYQPSDEALESMIKGYRVAANIIIFRREALLKVNYLSNRPKHGEDFSLAASICAAGFGNIYLADTLAYYRVWEDVGSLRRKRKFAEISGLRQVFEAVLEPAYKQRGWEMHSLLSSKTDFACRHADCLSWEIYNQDEKKELADELRKLSSSNRAKIYTWLYMNGFGKPLNLFAEIQMSVITILKKILINARAD
jgi:glycosyltransferase involved in cell wall biosynthesis